MTAEPIDAARAREAGLVNWTVPQERLHPEAQRIAAGIAANAPLSVRAGKKMIYSTLHDSLSEGLRKADELYLPVYQSEDAQEGPRAFREKRDPVWSGQ